jgi:hypothetical protein
MRPFSTTIVASAGGTSYSKPYIVDIHQNVYNIGFSIDSTGSALYTVQHSFTDPFTIDLSNPVNGTWQNNGIMTSAAGQNVGNYSFPCRAIRLALHDAASAQATFNVIQSGNSC